MDTVVIFENVEKWYRFRRRRIHALQDFTLSLRRGELFGLIGHNGAGKSTTLRLLLGLAFPSKGQVVLQGRSPRDPRARQSLTFLPEHPYFFEGFTPLELVEDTARIYGLPRAYTRERTRILAEHLQLQAYLRIPLRKLSKGNVQKVALLLTFLPDPEILILDEPLSGLDPPSRHQVMALLQKMHREGKTILFTSHILTDVERVCTRIGLLIRGRLRRTLTPEMLQSSGESLEALFLKELQA